MKNIADFNFKNHKVLLRVDFNVPLTKQLEVSDHTRIKAALPSIQKIIQDGGAVVLMSHLGRPKGVVSEQFSLRNVMTELSQLVGQSITFVEDCIGEKAEKLIQNLAYGQIMLLENLRFHKEEKKGDESFAKALANLGCDVYVNDAFGTAHRAHASTHTVAQFFPKDKRMMGFLMAKEIENAQKVLHHAEKPVTAILGGAKVSDKILLIESLLDKVDYLLIGGGMAYTFFKAMEGKIGNSLCEEDKLSLAKQLIEQSKAKGVNLLLPIDSVVADAFDNDANTQTLPSHKIPDGWMGLDIGTESRKQFAEVIQQSKTVFWNGPMGVFEMDNFAQGTKSVAQVVAQATQQNKAFTLIGGGDSVAAIKKMQLDDEVSYVSTGGGAMLEFLEGKELPGIAALKSC